MAGIGSKRDNGATRRSVMAGAAGFALTGEAALANPNPEGKPRVMLGPMLGATTPTSAKIWLRLSGDYFDAAVQVTDEPHAAIPVWRDAAVVRAAEADDFTTVASLEGLKPGRRYGYRLRVDGDADRYLRRLPPFAFKTAPEGPARFRVAFGSCARVQDDPIQPIWNGVRLNEPDLMFWLGDNIYGDSLNPEIIASEWRRQRFVPSFQPLGRSVSQLATWDDHDFGLDNFDRTNPIKTDTLRIFHQYWANPSAGLPDTPGVFFTHSFGGVDFFFLDGRYHRSPNSDEDGPDKTMLGAGQLAWLKAGLKASRAPFKVLISGGGWSKLKGPGGDAWSGFLHERDALFDFIRDEAISGVLLLSGDTHFPYVAGIPRAQTGGYDLYDFCSSALAQVVNGSVGRVSDRLAHMAPDVFVRAPVLNLNNAGVLDFDLTQSPARASFTVVDVNGRSVWGERLTLTADQLVNGAPSTL